MKTIFQISKLTCLILFLVVNCSLGQTPITLNLTTPVCNGDGVVVAQMTSGASGPFTYQWYTHHGSVFHTSNFLTDTLPNFSGGFVQLVCYDISGIYVGSANANYNFSFQVSKTVTPDICPTQSGSISLAVSGGVAPYSYSWALNGVPFPGTTNSLSGLASGYYNCIITDAAGCEMELGDIDSLNLGTLVPYVSPVLASVTSTPASCNNGTATVFPAGGQAPYTYLWSDGQSTAIATGLLGPSNYQVTVTDANGCYKISSEYISSTVTLQITNIALPENCSNGDGSIVVAATGGAGPYTYLWNTMATSQQISNLGAGSYIVTATDVNSCSKSTFIQLPSISPVQVSYQTTASVCSGATGSITTTVSGGTPPYSYQWLTNPIQTIPNPANLAAGNYNFIINDAAGCFANGTVQVPQASNLTATATTTPQACTASNGTATLIVSGGVSPYSYLWTNGQSTLTATGLSFGNHYGTVTDANGCSATACGFVSNQSIFSFILNPVSASCVVVPDGSLSATIIGGTPPYTYNWSNGATSSSISNLLPGYYSLLVTDANGCHFYNGISLGYLSILPCAGIVEGVVYADYNNNCVRDGGEPGLPNIPVSCNTTGVVKFTMPDGSYSFFVPPGNVDIQQLPHTYLYQNCPSSGIISVNVPSAGSTVILNIGDSVELVNDLRVNIWNLTLPRTGRDFVMVVTESNDGTTMQPTQSEYHFDSQINYNFSSVPPFAANLPAQHITFTNSNLNPLTSRKIQVNHHVPVTVPIGTILSFTDSIFPISNDITPLNNVDTKYEVVLNSYDPNYKEVTPAGAGVEGFISTNDSILEYVIHFQNLGNDFAENILVVDSLDSDLDWSSLRIRYATHSMTTEISSGGVVSFNFDNIYLPSVSQNEILSNGFLVYTIKQLPGLADGTEITNSADIYFDFNAPVKTNTTLNTILTTDVAEIGNELQLNLFPNPSNGIFNLSYQNLPAGEIEINLFSVSGQNVLQKKLNATGTGNVQVDGSQLAPGMYLAEVTTAVGKKFYKAIIQ
jgi:uncharacterized repeat protein (TIGR01451 family)